MKKNLWKILIFGIILCLCGMILFACNDKTEEPGETPEDETTYDPSVPAHDHTYGDWVTTKAATCTETGEKSHTCTQCGYKEKETISALGHNFVGISCTRCGITLSETAGIVFTLQDDNTYAATDYTGSEENVIILSSHNGVPVTKISGIRDNTTIKTVTVVGGSNAAITIDYGAFTNCTTLSSIFLPNNVVRINTNFNGCSNLSAINVDETNNEYASVEGELLNKDKTTYIRCPEGKNSCLVPDTVTTVKENAFSNCKIKTATMPTTTLSKLSKSFLKTLVLTSGTSIDGDAFSNCNRLTSITIPNSVTSIGMYAFYNCYSLTSVYYTGDVASWCGISFYSNPLSYAQNFYINNELVTEIIIPSTVMEIKSRAFNGWRGTSITIPDSVTSIGQYAFNGCSGLTSITIPDSVTSIGDCAFSGCRGLTSVTIGGSVTSIGEWAFSDCSSLTSITIPNSVTRIGNNAFEDCIGLTSVYYTGDIASWCKISFAGIYYNNGSKSNPLYYAHKLYISNTLVTEIDIPNTVTEIKAYTFYGWNGTSITIPYSVTSIGECAFSCCRGLTSVTIPDSLTSIGRHAFEYCTGLTSITIGNSVTSIGDNAFNGCYHLVEVYNQSSLNITKGNRDYGYIGFYAKAIYTEPYVSKLSTDENGYILYTDGSDISLIGYTGTATELTLPSGITEINQFSFYNCSGLTSITIPGSVTSIGDSAFEDCSGLTSITIPDSVTSIGKWAFRDCYKLVEVYNKSALNITKESEEYGYIGYYAKAIYTEPYTSKISTDKDGFILYSEGDEVSLIDYIGTSTRITVPDTVTEINKYAFHGSEITSINTGNGVKKIDDDAFWYSKLTDVTIGPNVETINREAFWNCWNLTDITIGKNVKNIGGYAFMGCPIENVFYEGDIASWCEISFYDSYSNPLRDARNFYVNNKLVTDMTIPDTVTEIKQYAFSGWKGTSITIGNNVKNIGECAFENCYQLSDVYISDVASWCGISFESLSSNPLYYGAVSLHINNKQETEIIIPDTIRTINDYAFYNWDSTSISIPDSVTSVGNDAFYGCSSLQYSEYDNGYYLGNETHPYLVFIKAKDTSITSCDIADTTKVIYSKAFYYCRRLTSITIPDSVTSIGSSAFYGCSGLTSITIPASVISIGSSAFYDCGRLTSVTIPDSVTSVGNDAFYGCSSLQYSEYDNGYYLGNETHPYLVLIKAKNKSITSCDIADTTKIIYYNAFSGCSSLTSITIPDSVTNIGSYAFEDCSGLTTITIPDSVTSIGSYAFYYCSGLRSVSIGNSVTSIGHDAFRGCTILADITFEGTKAQWDAISKGSYWNSNTGNYTVHCTDGDIKK